MKIDLTRIIPNYKGLPETDGPEVVTLKHVVLIVLRQCIKGDEEMTSEYRSKTLFPLMQKVNSSEGSAELDPGEVGIIWDRLMRGILDTWILGQSLALLNEQAGGGNIVPESDTKPR